MQRKFLLGQNVTSAAPLRLLEARRNAREMFCLLRLSPPFTAMTKWKRRFGLSALFCALLAVFAPQVSYGQQQDVCKFSEQINKDPQITDVKAYVDTYDLTGSVKHDHWPVVEGKPVPLPLHVRVRIIDPKAAEPYVDKASIDQEYHFKLHLPQKLHGGETVCLEAVSEDGNTHYSTALPIRIPESCHDLATKDAKPVPGLEITDVSKQEDDLYTVSVKNKNADGKQRYYLCINGGLVPDEFDHDKKKFTDVKLQEGDSVRVQVQQGKTVYPPSDDFTVEEEDTPYRPTVYSLIAGEDNFWYASQGEQTSPFLQLYVAGAEGHLFSGFYHSVWGRLRLLGIPQPTTNGVGTTFADPTGTISALKFDTVGTSIDYQLGGEFPITDPGRNWERLGFIYSGGGTTPLSTQNAPIFFKTPAQGSYECSQILSRFTTAAGYPALTPGDSKTVSCLKASSNGADIAVNNIAFVNQDRSNVLLKWSAGLRGHWSLSCSDSFVKCQNAISTLDLTVGQDAAMTRGQVRNFVSKIDGSFALPTGAGHSYLYLYFSAYTRFRHNVDLPPLNLATPSPVPTLPDPATVVLPLKQPDRDFFRVGIGLNVGQVLCKLSNSLCNDKEK